MELRTYKWEDLEKIRKFFKITYAELAEKLHCSRQTLYATSRGLYSEEATKGIIQKVGMAWEIFAIYFVNSFLVTRSIDTHDSYGLLLDYISYCNEHPNDESHLNFGMWYLSDDCDY